MRYRASAVELTLPEELLDYGIALDNPSIVGVIELPGQKVLRMRLTKVGKWRYLDFRVAYRETKTHLGVSKCGFGVPVRLLPELIEMIERGKTIAEASDNDDWEEETRSFSK